MALSAQVGSTMLDGPPPSPQLGGASPTGDLAFAGMAPPPISSGQLPPELLQGAMQVGVKLGDALDSLAQLAPDLAQDFGTIKTLLQNVLAKLITNGAGPTAPTAAGAQFPGGGMDRGIAGGGTA